MSNGLFDVDVQGVLAGLQPFQRRTVEHVFHRLYEAPDSTHRFLVADEVGLGKTMVAKGVIAKAIDHMKHEDIRFDVVYICSNSDLARQNITRLNVASCNELPGDCRITLMPVNIAKFDDKINFIPLTPGTSFDMKNNLGEANERALLCLLLRKYWQFKDNACLRVFQGGVKKLGSFQSIVSRLSDKVEQHHNQLFKAFYETLEERNRECRQHGEADYRRRFEDVVEGFRNYPNSMPQSLKDSTRKFVGDMRLLLARSCLQSLEPDLVILDEFQRFRHLLDEETEAGHLARDLFNYSDEKSNARVLLLSATPYKVYTVYGESDDHYKDFLFVLKFLMKDEERLERVKNCIDDYRASAF